MSAKYFVVVLAVAFLMVVMPATANPATEAIDKSFDMFIGAVEKGKGAADMISQLPGFQALPGAAQLGEMAVKVGDMATNMAETVREMANQVAAMAA